MKSTIRGIFTSVFLFGHGFTLPTLAVVSYGLVAFSLGYLSGGSQFVHSSLILAALSAPVAMTLMFAKPRFKMHQPDTTGMPDEFATIVDHVHRLKAGAVSLYESWYTPTFRIAYGLFSFIVLLSALQLIRRVFTPEVVVLLALNAALWMTTLGILCLLNWLASSELKSDSIA